MADNTGNYITYAELLAELKIGGSLQITSEATVLSNKATVTGGDTFEFVGGTPLVGQVLFRGGIGEEITDVLAAPDRGKVEKTPSKILVGAAFFLSSENIGQERGEEIILDAMALIDEITGQFFNKRDAVIKLEGKNSEVLWFSVPIISITELIINSTDIELFEGEDKDFIAFKGRALPQDDRRNPRIKLNLGKSRTSIFAGNMTTRAFVKGVLTKITGSYGFLDPNGETPRLIKKVTTFLASKEASTPLISTATGSATGPLKRLRVDLNEQEFFELKAATHIGGLTGSLGSPEVDKILNRFKTPIRISGSIQFIGNIRGDNQRGTFS